MTNNIFNRKELLINKLRDTIIYDTGIAGKHLVIFACIHGNEVVGLNAINELYNKLENGEIKLLNGKITFIFANREGYDNNVRFTDENLNRMFIENKSNSKEGKRASEIEGYLLDQKVDFILDLHSVSVGDLQMAIINKNWDTDKISKLTDTNIIVSDINNIIIGTTLSLSNRIKSEALTVECGNHNSENCLLVAMWHIYLVLNYLEMTKINRSDRLSENENKELYKIQSLIPTAEGFSWNIEDIRTGRFINSGECYAISNKGEHVIDRDIYILMPSKVPNPKDTDNGFFAERSIINYNNS